MDLEVIYKVDKEEVKQQMRRLPSFHKNTSKPFFVHYQNFELKAVEIAAIYENRWQRETFFKKLK